MTKLVNFKTPISSMAMVTMILTANTAQSMDEAPKNKHPIGFNSIEDLKSNFFTKVDLENYKKSLKGDTSAPHGYTSSEGNRGDYYTACDYFLEKPTLLESLQGKKSIVHWDLFHAYEAESRSFEIYKREMQKKNDSTKNYYADCEPLQYFYKKEDFESYKRILEINKLNTLINNCIPQDIKSHAFDELKSKNEILINNHFCSVFGSQKEFRDNLPAEIPNFVRRLLGVGQDEDIVNIPLCLKEGCFLTENGKIVAININYAYTSLSSGLEGLSQIKDLLSKDRKTQEAAIDKLPEYNLSVMFTLKQEESNAFDTLFKNSIMDFHAFESTKTTPSQPVLPQQEQDFWGNVGNSFTTFGNTVKSAFVKDEARPYRILSLDGGGMRGVGTAEFLRVIASEIKEKHNQELWQFFDLIVGTSTGGILALAAGMGLPADQFIKIYFDNGDTIFTKKAGCGLIGSAFSKEGLKAVIKDRLPGSENMTLKDAKTGVAVTSYEPASFKTRLFTNQVMTGKEGVNFFDQYFIPAGNVPAIKAIRMTTAAPGYFKGSCLNEGACYNKPNEGKKHAFIDGGLGTNNPSALAYDYVLDLMDKGTIDKNRKIQFVSLGTGEYQAADLTRNAGFLKFLVEDGIEHAIDGGQKDTIRQFEGRIKKQEQSNKADYFCFNFNLKHKVDLAVTDPKILQEMVDSANRETKKPEFRRMLEVLVK